MPFFRRNFQHYRKTEVQNVKSDVFYRANCALPPPPPRKSQPYRGFSPLGRCAPRSARPAHPGPDKTRYFRSAGRPFPGREAGSVFRTRDTIAKLAHRIANHTYFVGPAGARGARIACGTPFSLASDRKNAGGLKPASSSVRAACRFFAAGPRKRGEFESQVARIACGTRILRRRSVKLRCH